MQSALKPRLLALLATAALVACAPAVRAPAPGAPPPLAREFRGVWIATVGNIDWPARPGLPVDTQKAQLVAILDRAAELGLNAAIFQVRTAADALYESSLEPWSEYLTGTQGQAPGYDPLAFAVEAAHERGLELHAWFNPYRARHPSARSAPAATHVSRTRPELVRSYGTHLWLDPGEPAVQDHSVGVMLDVLRRYDVDGIHIDDYFYPYRERDSARVEIPFPDDASWERYVASGGKLARGDWRRHNVDAFVARLDREIHQVKPWVRFGVSPIGIWRPGYPADACCFDAYESIYADARKWFAEGTLDYFVPQLYRTLSDTLMNYGVMLGWWGEQNLRDRHLYVGMIPNSVRSERNPNGWAPEEIIGQVFVARGHPAAQGHVHFSARALMRDTLTWRLQRSVYRSPALVPPATWLDDDPPAAPRLGSASAGAVTITPGDGEPLRWWVVRTRDVQGQWSARRIPASQARVPLPAAVREVWVSAVDRVGNESPATRLRLRD